MTLILEDGSGVADANSYASEAMADAYFETRGNTAWGDYTGDKEALLIRATAWIDATYYNRFPGVRTNGADQALLWPRKAGVLVYGVFYQTGPILTVTDFEGQPIPVDSIPAALIAATCEAADRERIKAGVLAPDLARGGAIKSVQAGSVGVEWFPGASAQTVFTLIDSLLAGILISSTGYTARAVRA